MITLREQRHAEILLTEAYGVHLRDLNAYAHFKLHNRELGEDLVQETFMKTWKYLIKNKKVDLMKAFLFHVLNGLIIDEYRKHKPTSLDVLIENGLEPSGEDHYRLLNIFDGKGAVLLIEKLPQPYQKVMYMRYVQDLSITEIACTTGQSKNTIAVQAHRGLKKLTGMYHRTEAVVA